MWNVQRLDGPRSGSYRITPPVTIRQHISVVHFAGIDTMGFQEHGSCIVESWKQFEVLVAALHHSSSNGGTVTWDEKINRRQFDLAIRFTQGVHDYLTVIECPDSKNAVPVSDVEAFVTKANYVQANKAVVVSSSGFQSGAIEVAQRENVVLLTVTERYEEPPMPADAEKEVALNIMDLSVRFGDGDHIQFEDGPKLQYLVNHTCILDPAGIRKSVSEILATWVQGYVADGTKEQLCSIAFPAGSAFEDQEGNTRRDVSALAFGAPYIDAYMSKSTPPLDFQLQQTLAKKYALTRLDGSQVFESFFTDLSLGRCSDIEVGKYYSNPALGFFYRCEDISDDLVTWVVVESYQHGKLMQARFTANAKYNEQYVPVTDKKKLVELRRLYETYARLR